MPTELTTEQWHNISTTAFVDAWNWFMNECHQTDLVIRPGEDRPTALDRREKESDKDYAARTDPYRTVIRNFQAWFQKTMDGWGHDIGAWKKAMRSQEESADDGVRTAEAQIDSFPTTP